MSSHVSVLPGGEQRATVVRETLLEAPGDVTTAEALHCGVDIEHVMKAPCHL